MSFLLCCTNKIKLGFSELIIYFNNNSNINNNHNIKQIIIIAGYSECKTRCRIMIGHKQNKAKVLSNVHANFSSDYFKKQEIFS